MTDPRHSPETLWDMQECAFIHGCYACLVPPETLLSDVRYIRISPIQERRIRLIRSKGYQVWSDGSTTLANIGDRIVPWFLALTTEEIDACDKGD